MLTKISKWMLYIASCLPVYVFLSIRLLFLKQDVAESILQQVNMNFAQQKYIIAGLSILCVISIPMLAKTRRFNPNERIAEAATKNCTGEVAAFFIPFILSFLTIGIDWYGWMINVAIFVLFGFITVQADWIHLCPVFTYAGYRLYKTENGAYILSRLTLEQYNQLLLDDINGIEVKVLTKDLYMVVKADF